MKINKRIIAKEWLILVGCLLFAYAVVMGAKPKVDNNWAVWLFCLTYTF